MKIVKIYLEYLSGKTESIFPMDSIHTGKPLNLKKVRVYDEDEEQNKNEEIEK